MNPDGLPIEGLSGYINEVVNTVSEVNPLYQKLWSSLNQLGLAETANRTVTAQQELHERGVSFLSNGAQSYFLAPGQQQTIPFDPVPRLLDHQDWQIIKKGISQRAQVFNLFLHDLFTGRQTTVPDEVIRSSVFFHPDYLGWVAQDGVYVTLYGSDIVSLGTGTYLVLEDNLGNPAGSVYPIVIRQLMLRYFPELLSGYQVKPLRVFAGALRAIHLDLCRDVEDPLIVYLTRGPGGVDFYESMYLSQQTGFALVDPEDLQVSNEGEVYLTSLDGTQRRVDLIYNRLSPFFRLTHELPKIVKAGHVRAVNLYGSIILSDKGFFPFVPEMIRYYLQEEPILPQPETSLMLNSKFRKHVFQNLERFVIKWRSGMGGKNVLIGRQASRDEATEWYEKTEAAPLEYIAQEVVDFSRHLRLSSTGASLREAAIDLRVFGLMGREVYVPTELLTRCDRHNSGIVNVSSGGAIKDTWIAEGDNDATS